MFRMLENRARSYESIGYAIDLLNGSYFFVNNGDTYIIGMVEPDPCTRDYAPILIMECDINEYYSELECYR